MLLYEAPTVSRDFPKAFQVSDPGTGREWAVAAVVDLTIFSI